MFNNLPNYKTIIKSNLRVIGDPIPSKNYPVLDLEDKRIYLYHEIPSTYSFGKYKEDLWLSGFRNSPPTWYVFFMELKDHPNRKLVNSFFNVSLKMPIPEEIDIIYSLRLQIKQIIKNEEFAKHLKVAEDCWKSIVTVKNSMIVL